MINKYQRMIWTIKSSSSQRLPENKVFPISIEFISLHVVVGQITPQPLSQRWPHPNPQKWCICFLTWQKGFCKCPEMGKISRIIKMDPIRILKIGRCRCIFEKGQRCNLTGFEERRRGPPVKMCGQPLEAGKETDSP